MKHLDPLGEGLSFFIGETLPYNAMLEDQAALSCLNLLFFRVTSRTKFTYGDFV
jgi:hypothetical protein